MAEPKNYWDVHSAIQQIESCGFECEAGPIEHNDAFVFLREALARGPEFMMGQGVFYTVEAETPAGKVSERRPFFIVGCRMDSGEESTFWTYSLSNDPPRPWHYGETQYRGIHAKELSLTPEPPE